MQRRSPLRNNLFLYLILLLLTACGGGSPRKPAEPVQIAAPPPLETVRRLAEINKQALSVVRDSTASYPPEIRAILNRGSIRFAMSSQDQKPFFYIHAETGELIGLDVELGYEIANRLRVRAIFNRDARTFDDVVKQVINKEADVALSKLSITTQRAELVRFTNPYISFRQSLLVNRLEFAKIGPEEQLANYIRNYHGTLGVIKNSSYMNYAVTNFPLAKIETFNTWDDTVNALFEGKILAAYRDEGEILIISATKKDASILMKPVFINDKRDPIAMAVSVDAPLLQEWLNVFLTEYLLQRNRELTPKRLVERHFTVEDSGSGK
jgi:ABC-type amino acid transport substrate-binding protein